MARRTAHRMIAAVLVPALAATGLALALTVGRGFGLSTRAAAAPASREEAHGHAGQDHAGEEADHTDQAAGHDHAGEEADHERVGLSERERETFGIVLETAGPGSLSFDLELPAEVRLNEDAVAHVVPRLAGVVVEVRKSVGDQVRAGEVMAVLESRELADANAGYLAASTRLRLAQRTYEREKALWQQEISAEREYLEAERVLEEAEIELRAAEQKLRAVGVSDECLERIAGHPEAMLTRYEIRAPFDGEVIEKHIVLGEALEAQTDAFVVADLRSVWIDLSVYQKDLPSVWQGQDVWVCGPPGVPATRGRIDYVSPIVARETRTALARTILPNPEGDWRPGLLVDAKIAIGNDEAPIVVPRDAIQRLEAGPVVFVEEAGSFEPAPVVLGRETQDRVEVLSGLSAGQRFVAQGAFELKAKMMTSGLGAHAGHGH